MQRCLSLTLPSTELEEGREAVQEDNEPVAAESDEGVQPAEGADREGTKDTGEAEVKEDKRVSTDTRML